MISVCMATYNGEKFLKKQLESILAQLSDEDELIISDDCSSDSTLEIIKSYNDKRIKILNHIPNKNLSKKKYCRNFYLATNNFENALSVAEGDYIFLSDQDDIWYPNKIEVMKNYLETNDLVMCNFSTINENDKITKKIYYQSNPVSKGMLNNIICCKFLGCCMAFNKSLLDYTLPFPKKLIGHDYWIGCLGVNCFRYSYIEEPLHYYRRTGSNVSSATGKSNNPILFRIKYRIVFLFQVMNKVLFNKVK